MQRPARRDDTIDLLNEMLRGRLRATFEQFCAEIPEILDGLQHAAIAPSDGREFVRVLLAWVRGASSRSQQASRYLLMWYAKTLAGKAAHATPECRAVAELIRKHLTNAEIALVDQALSGGWESLDNAASLKQLAYKRRREFKASLTPDETTRFAPYLAAFIPPIAGPGAPAPEGGPPPPAPSSWTAGGAGGAAVVIGVPLAMMLGWYAVRGRDEGPRSVPAPETPPIEGFGPRADGAPDQRPAAVVPPSAVVDASVPGGRVLPDGSPASFVWTRQVSGVNEGLTGVASSGARAVVVGWRGTLLWSDDAVVWTAVSLPRVFTFNAVAYGGGRFVAVGSTLPGTHAGRLIATSTDGKTWSPQTWRDRTALARVAYGRDTFVAVGSLGGIVRSTDGERWQTVSAETGDHLSVSFIDDQFVVNTHRGTVMRSPDGLAWTTSSRQVMEGYTRVASGNRIYLSGSRGDRNDEDGQAMVRLSPDLATWTAYEIAGSHGFANAIFVDDRFVIAGDGVCTSTDGLAWTREVTGGTSDVTWTGSMLIAVGDRGEIFTATPAP